jgi:hypothetical protein
VRRVWLLSLPRAPGFTYQAELDLAAMSSAADPPQAVGHLEVARYELAHPELPLARLDQRLAQAEVRLGDRACPPSRAGFRCTLGEAEAWVEEATVEVDGLPRSCLTVRASGDAGPITIAFPALPLGRELRGNSGLLPGEGTNTSATLAVRIDGEQAGAVELDGAGWPSFEVDTTRWAGQRRPVMLELSVPEGRPLCLQAVTMP